MSTLYLIRHGQASFGAADYDVLSERGAAQARALGADFAERAVAIDAVYSGPRQRHLDTTRHFLDALGERGGARHEPEILAELDEYPAIELLAMWLPKLAAEDPAYRALATPGQTRDPAGRARFQGAFERIIDKWARGELDTGGLESFDHFQTRVRRGLATIMAAQGAGRSVAVVTSGGPICMAMQLALGLADEQAVRLGWVVTNGSVSEFRYRHEPPPSLFSIIRFNGACHLRDPALVTYR